MWNGTNSLKCCKWMNEWMKRIQLSLSSDYLRVHQATGVCIIEHNMAGTANNVDGVVLVQDSALNGIPDSHVDTSIVNCKGHTVGPWDIVPFHNLIHFAVCGFCSATAGPNVRPMWRNHSITPRELHFNSQWIIQLDPCDDANVSNTYRLFAILCKTFAFISHEV